MSLSLIKNSKGQGVLEYVILTSLIGIFCLVAVKSFGNVLETRINNMKSYVVKQIDLKR
jgi:Tfp pilus assembly protein PilE